LRHPGYLWGENLTRVATLDIGDHIGWAQIEECMRLDAADRAALHSEVHWPEAADGAAAIVAMIALT
jgi:hypothetical protein